MYSLLYRGLYFGPKTIFIPLPFWKWYFSPSRDTSFFDSHRGLFALILPYFAFILPFYFSFSHFLSPFLLFLSSFFLFLLYFPPFSLRLFIFFPPNDLDWYFSPSPPGGGYFPIYRPLLLYMYHGSLTQWGCSITRSPKGHFLGKKELTLMAQ